MKIWASPLLFIHLFFLFFTFSTLVGATDHIVGANKGWNPGLNYTLWSHNQTFYVGDFISFRYQKNQYNVFQVNKTGYDNCTIEGAVGNWSSGKDFILLTKAQRYYFICGTGGCFNGMKVSIIVHQLPSPPTANNTHHHLSQKSSAAAAAAAAPGNISLLVLSAALMAVLGSLAFDLVLILNWFFGVFLLGF